MPRSSVVTLTKEEQKAIASLERLAKKWPKSLQLFSWSGSLEIIKDEAVVGSISGIPNDGGDPDGSIDQHAEIDYE